MSASKVEPIRYYTAPGTCNRVAGNLPVSRHPALFQFTPKEDVMKKLMRILVAFLLTTIVTTSCGLDICWDEPCWDEKGLCRDCVVSMGCKSGTCACVDNGETGKRYCWACVPSEYDTLKGTKQNQTYYCPKVKD